MPDSLPPIQGPASPRERDLDALLSSGAVYPTVVLGPVSGVLDALRAAAAPDELEGEAAARAAFRLFALPRVGVAGVAAVPAPLYQGAVAAQGHPVAQGSTAGLPRVASGPRHRRPRHRRPRRPVPWHGRWQVMSAACGVAAAVIVGVMALAGTFSGPGGQQGRTGQRPSVQATGTSSKHPTSSLLGTATARPTPRPSGSSQAASPETLCHQYMEFLFMRPVPAAGSPESSVYQQLSRLAGDGPMRIAFYCAGLSRQSEPGSSPGGRGRPGEPAVPRADRAGPGAPQAGARSLRTGSSRAGQVRDARTAR